MLAHLTPKGFEKVSSPEKVNTWVSGYYYTQLSFNPDMDAIRRGVELVVECNGFDWRENLDLKILKKVFQEPQYACPSRHHSISYYHTGLFFNMLFGMAKKFQPEDMLRSVRMNCQAPDFLDEIYLKPTVEAANKRVLAKYEAALEQRYLNEATFSLLKSGR